MSFVEHAAARVAHPEPCFVPAGEQKLPFPATGPAPDAVRGEVEVVLALRHAGSRRLRLAYELAGRPGAPVVFVAGGISADRHVAASATFAAPGWAEGLRTPGRALDPGRCRVLAFDFLGADGALDTPIDTADQADAIAALLDALAIERLAGFVGYSYGAQVGLQFAVRHPRRLQALVAVSGSHRAHPYAAAWRALQRKVVALGQLQCDDARGLSLAREFAMLSYRTPAEFAARFDAAPVVANGRVRVAAEDYLENAGTRFAARTPVTAWLRLSESIDLHRVALDAVARAGVDTTVVAVDGDWLVPLADAVDLVEALGPRGRLRVLRSRWGHDAFLKDHDRIDAILATALGAQAGGAA